MTAWRTIATVLLLAVAAAPAALDPTEVAVVANSASGDSVELAKHYASQRGIPAARVLTIRTGTDYDISRADYEAQIRRPLAERLKQPALDGKVRCLVLLYGVPVRILDADGKTGTAVDSELALLLHGPRAEGKAQDNPLHWRHAAAAAEENRPPTLMVARIDGPTLADALRIIKAAAATEADGLAGTFYIDAGGKLPEYDAHLRALARFVRKLTQIPVVLDEERTCFGRDQCADAALYVGWYSPREYVPAFLWARGAVGWHIAAAEAQNLRDPAAREWCVQMIQRGVAATLGAVDAPYLGDFPLPEEFFPLLLTGNWTVAECYWRTVPKVGWRMILLADPLYNPFAAKPQVKMDALSADLAGAAPDAKAKTGNKAD